MHDRTQQVLEGAAAQVVFPPHHLSLQRFQARQRQPAHRAGMHPVDRRGGKSGQRQVMHHGLEPARPGNAQLRRNRQLGARRTAIFLRGKIVAARAVEQIHGGGLANGSGLAPAVRPNNLPKCLPSAFRSWLTGYTSMIKNCVRLS